MFQVSSIGHSLLAVWAIAISHIGYFSRRTLHYYWPWAKGLGTKFTHHATDRFAAAFWERLGGLSFKPAKGLQKASFKPAKGEFQVALFYS